MIRSILLATDGSDTAERAADFAASLAIRFKAKVIVLHAFTPESGDKGLFTSNRLVVYETREEAKSLVGKVAARLRKMGVDELETEIVAGPPANVVLGFGETIQPDLIIIGARGVSIWRGALLGSVSMAIAHRAEVPVLLVR